LFLLFFLCYTILYQFIKITCQNIMPKLLSLSLSLSRNRPLNQNNKKRSNGFTLLEILLVVGIIAILAGIVIIAINPSKQLATVRNTERKSDIRQIESAITQYYIDNSRYPDSLTGDLTEICDTGAYASSSIIADCTDLINLSELVPVYLTAIPKDPSATTTDHAGYQIVLTNNKIGLFAPAELGQTITIGTVPTVAAGCGDPANADCWSTDNITAGYTMWSTEYVNTGAQSDTDGKSNSDHIMANHANTNPWATNNYPAIAACDQYTGDGHSDWYLPSKQQLTDAYGVVSGFQSDFYWSSTEYSDHPENDAWYFYMYDGDASGSNKGNPFYLVRCLR
jgi:prepilin-type N-terminal cleavage/methylation domain-containing protein